MAAPTKPCDVKILLANSEPSTHGTLRPNAEKPITSALTGRADDVFAARSRTAGDLAEPFSVKFFVMHNAVFHTTM
jgi:hypothetical protein